MLRLLGLLSLCILQAVFAEGCNIKANSDQTAGKPFSRGKPVQAKTTYSCTSNTNCDYSVHVVGVYEADQRHTAYYHPTRRSDVYVNVTGDDSRPLVLVLSSHEPINWTLHIPDNVTVNRVILSSTLNSSVTSNQTEVLKVEKGLHIYAYGYNRRGDRTWKLLNLLSKRLGPVSSFTGTFTANKWILNIDRTYPDTVCQPKAITEDSSSTEERRFPSTLVWYGMVAMLSLVLIVLILIIGVACVSKLWLKKSRTVTQVGPRSYKVLRNDTSVSQELQLPKYHEITSI